MKWTLAAVSAALILSGMMVAAFAQSGTPNTQRVTLRLHNASLSDITKWLTDHGINFVADQTSAGENRKLSINLRNVPLQDALTAISDALGGSWTKRGSVYVFKPSKWSELATVEREGLQIMPPKILGVPQPKAPKSQKAAPLEPKAFEFELGEGKDGIFQRALEEFARKIGSLAEKGTENGALRKAIEKEAKAFAKKMRGAERWSVIPPLPDLPNLDRLRRLEVLPEMKALPKMELKDLESLKGLKDFKLKELDSLKGLKELKLKELDDLKLQLPKISSISSLDGKALIASLTPAQIEKQANQGYLTVEDLNPKQKQMIGAAGLTGSWTISFSIDGKNVTIKSK